MADLARLLKHLDEVLDPELDQSIVKLGFVEKLEERDGKVTVTLRLPTYWCSPNFVYLMGEDVRSRLLRDKDVTDVIVRIEDHFASDQIELGVNSGCAFSEVFPDESSADLEELRRLFRRKGYLSRQLMLVQALRRAGLNDEEICALRLGDLRYMDGRSWVKSAQGLLPVQPGSAVQRYLTRRKEVGLDDSPHAWLMVDLEGNRLLGHQLPGYLRQIRATLINFRANAALCTALLASREQWVSTGKERTA